MKYSLALLALSGAAFSASILERQVETIVGVVNKIEKATASLDTAIKAFSGDASAFKSAAKELTDTVNSGVTTVNGASSITLTDSVKIQGQVSNLQATVESVVTDLISKKDAIVSAGEGGSVEQSLKEQLTGAKALQVAISSKVPPEVQSLAQQLSAGINTSLEKGVSAFAGTGSASSSSGSSSSGSSPSADMAGMSGMSGSATSSSSGSSSGSGSSSSSGSGSGSGTAPKAAVSTTSAPKPATYTGAAPRAVAGSFAGVLAICAAIFVL